MQHPQHDELLAALKDAKTYPTGYVYFCDPETCSFIEIFQEERTIRLKVRWLDNAAYAPLPVLQQLGFKCSEHVARDPFIHATRKVFSAECQAKTIEKVAQLAFAVVRKFFQFSDDRCLDITATDYPDEWPGLS